jgi:hypothetical protein
VPLAATAPPCSFALLLVKLDPARTASASFQHAPPAAAAETAASGLRPRMATAPPDAPAELAPNRESDTSSWLKLAQTAPPEPPPAELAWKLQLSIHSCERCASTAPPLLALLLAVNWQPRSTTPLAVLTCTAELLHPEMARPSTLTPCTPSICSSDSAVLLQDTARRAGAAALVLLPSKFSHCLDAAIVMSDLFMCRGWLATRDGWAVSSTKVAGPSAALTSSCSSSKLVRVTTVAWLAKVGADCQGLAKHASSACRTQHGDSGRRGH